MESAGRSRRVFLELRVFLLQSLPYYHAFGWWGTPPQSCPTCTFLGNLRLYPNIRSIVKTSVLTFRDELEVFDYDLRSSWLCRYLAPNLLGILGEPEQLETLEFLENETGENPAGCVIWMHGLRPMPQILSHRSAAAVERKPYALFSPTLPVQPITVNGMEMRGWYDINPASLASNDDIRESVEAINQLVDAEVARSFTSQITVAGFPQGGVMLVELGLGHPQRLRGIMALSTYVNDHEHLADRVGFANVETVFMAHGVRPSNRFTSPAPSPPDDIDGSCIPGTVAGIRHGPSGLPATNHAHRSMAELNLRPLVYRSPQGPPLVPTHSGWIHCVLADFDSFLQDHASAEKKHPGWR